MKRFWAPFLLLLSSAAVASAATVGRIGEVQARTLVLAALSPQQRALPGLEAIEDEQPVTSGFRFYTVTWKGLPNGSVVVGNYAVDPRTGDVFSSTRECEEETNPRLAAVQARVRAEIHLSASAYRQLKTKGPLCEP